MKFHYIDKCSQVRKDAVVLWAPPSHGNVGQIAIDSLLLSAEKHPSSCVKYFGFFESDLILPLTGYQRAPNSKESMLCKPIDVYEINNSSTRSVIYLIQQRVPCIRGKSNEFVEEFMKLVSSVFGTKMNMILITGAAMTIELQENEKLVKSNGIFHISNFPNSFSTEDAYLEGVVRNLSNLSNICASFDECMENGTSVDNIPHGMLVSRCVLVSNQQSENPLKIICIGKLCFEGSGNHQDGIDLAGILSKLVLI